jgi:hypothetical protein
MYRANARTTVNARTRTTELPRTRPHARRTAVVAATGVMRFVISFLVSRSRLFPPLTPATGTATNNVRVSIDALRDARRREESP